MPTPDEIAALTYRILELERRVIALALATGHPELAAPFPDPGYAAAQRARDGVGTAEPVKT